jgi:dipeptidyl-peptidase 4
MATMSLPGQIARTRRYSLGVPAQFTIVPGGAAVLFLRSRAGDDPVACLWALDLDSGRERLLADPGELLAGEQGALGAGIGAYAADRAAGLVAFALDRRLWTVDVAGGRARCLPVPAPARSWATPTWARPGI